MRQFALVVTKCETRRIPAIFDLSRANPEATSDPGAKALDVDRVARERLRFDEL
jgi:hypothetical protein